MKTASERTYVRDVHYYETDRMGIVHHSNYIRWMEEARMAYMLQKGIDYTKIEMKNVLMPVIKVECSYKRPVSFGDVISIATQLISFNGVKAIYTYEFYLENSTVLLATARSEHCFIDAQTRKPVNLKKRLTDEYNTMLQTVRSEGSIKGEL